MLYFLSMAHCPTAPEDLVLRLNRIEGQIKALKRSLEKTDTSDCTQTLFQLKAATNGLKRFGEASDREYASRCMKAGKSKTELSKDIDQIISTAFTLS